MSSSQVIWVADPALLRSHLAPPERTLIDILTATAAEYPDAAAIDDGGANSANDGVLTYAELLDEIERRVAFFRHRTEPALALGKTRTCFPSRKR